MKAVKCLLERGPRRPLRHWGSHMKTFGAVVLALMVVGCGDSVTGTATGTSTPTATTNPDLDGDGILNAVDACPNVAETVNRWEDDDGCPDNTTEFYGLVQESVESYWNSVFDASGLIYTPISTFQAYQGTFSSPCGDLESGNAIYCPINGGIYYDQSFVDSFFDVGDASAAFIIGHEIGHHVGFSLGWFDLAWSLAFPHIPHYQPVISGKETELMADCFSGNWVSWVDAQGVLEPGDLDEVLNAILAVADPDDTWFDPDAHGTDVQRVVAFAIGFDGEPADCVSAGFFDLFPTPEN
jgi:predicted metalloprotease